MGFTCFERDALKRLWFCRKNTILGAAQEGRESRCLGANSSVKWRGKGALMKQKTILEINSFRKELDTLWQYIKQPATTHKTGFLLSLQAPLQERFYSCAGWAPDVKGRSGGGYRDWCREKIRISRNGYLQAKMNPCSRNLEAKESWEEAH